MDFKNIRKYIILFGAIIGLLCALNVFDDKTTRSEFICNGNSCQIKKYNNKKELEYTRDLAIDECRTFELHRERFLVRSTHNNHKYGYSIRCVKPDNTRFLLFDHYVYNQSTASSALDNIQRAFSLRPVVLNLTFKN